MSVESKLNQLGLKLPETPKPIAAYVPAVKVASFIFTSGQIPIVKGNLKFKGKVGKDLTLEEGYEAAKVCALNALSAVRNETGSLDKIERIVKLVGYVNSADGFNQQPLVINGASELLQNLFGESGKHARVAIGVSELPNDAAVEVEMIVKIRE